MSTVAARSERGWSAALAAGLPLAVFSIAAAIGLYADQGSDRHDAAVVAQLLYVTVPAFAAVGVGLVDARKRVWVACIVAAVITLAIAEYLINQATTYRRGDGYLGWPAAFWQEIGRNWVFLGTVFGALVVSFLLGARFIAGRRTWPRLMAGALVATAVGFVGFVTAIIVNDMISVP